MANLNLTATDPNKLLMIIDGHHYYVDHVLLSESLMRDFIIAVSNGAQIPVIMQST